MTYNEKIEQLRKQHNLTQQQLADKLGTSRQMVIRWEKGWNIPSLYYAQKICEVFSIDIAQLLDESSLTKQTSTSSQNQNKMLSKAIFICFLSFFPTFIYFVGEYLCQAVRQYLLLQGFNMAVDYRRVTDLIDSANLLLTGILITLIAVWWICQLVKFFSEEDSKFLRLHAFNQWKIGLFFVLLNLLFYAWEGLFGKVTFGVVIDYFLLGLLSFYLVGAIDLAFKKFGEKHIAIEPNDHLKRLNHIYFVISSIIFALLVALIIYCCSIRHASVFFVLAFGLIILGVLGFLTIIFYLVSLFSNKFKSTDKE